MGFLDSLPSDAALVSRALSNRYSAFESLALRHQKKAYAIARAIGVPTSSVDDVVQESFPSVPPGKYRLEVESPAHIPHIEEVELGEVQVAREVSLVPASWIAVELGGSVNPFRDYWVKATLVSGDDPAWKYSTADGRSLAMASTQGKQAEPAARDLHLRLKTRPGRYTIHIEVARLSVRSSPLLTQDVDVDVPEAGEAPVRLLPPEN